MDLSIVIPTYNEKENISVLLAEIFSTLKKNKMKGKVIIVDDNSPDGTGEIANKLAKKYNVYVIHRKDKKGYGNSIIAGMKSALRTGSDIIITMDSDFSHNPKVIPSMIRKIVNGADVVIGSRRIPGGKIVGWSLWRYFCSSGATRFSKLVLGLKTRDITSGFRAYRKEVLNKIEFESIRSNGYSFLEEILSRMESYNFNIVEIPIVFVDRKHGKSKLSKKEIIKFFITILRLRYHQNKRLSKILIVGLYGIFYIMLSTIF